MSVDCHVRMSHVHEPRLLLGSTLNSRQPNNGRKIPVVQRSALPRLSPFVCPTPACIRRNRPGFCQEEPFYGTSPSATTSRVARHPNTGDYICMTVTAQYARQTNCHAPPFAVPPSHEAAMKSCGPDDHVPGRTAMIHSRLRTWEALVVQLRRQVQERSGRIRASPPRARRTRPFRRVPRGTSEPLLVLPAEYSSSRCLSGLRLPTRVANPHREHRISSSRAEYPREHTCRHRRRVLSYRPVFNPCRRTLTRLSLGTRLHNSQQEGSGMHPDDLSQHRRPFSYRATFSSPLLHTVDADRAGAVAAARAIFATPWKLLHGRYSPFPIAGASFIASSCAKLVYGKQDSTRPRARFRTSPTRPRPPQTRSAHAAAAPQRPHHLDHLPAVSSASPPPMEAGSCPAPGVLCECGGRSPTLNAGLIAFAEIADRTTVQRDSRPGFERVAPPPPLGDVDSSRASYTSMRRRAIGSSYASFEAGRLELAPLSARLVDGEHWSRGACAGATSTAPPVSALGASLMIVRPPYRPVLLRVVVVKALRVQWVEEGRKSTNIMTGWGNDGGSGRDGIGWRECGTG
ncbi:hypothetical protein B0H14DRAFT_3161298 [Mycena olivaceomarginata]|nr:hypothetical protein B0H14DRAFT_3161298 [Mycena olivaceomarginata]